MIHDRYSSPKATVETGSNKLRMPLGMLLGGLSSMIGYLVLGYLVLCYRAVLPPVSGHCALDFFNGVLHSGQTMLASNCIIGGVFGAAFHRLHWIIVVMGSFILGSLLINYNVSVFRLVT